MDTRLVEAQELPVRYRTETRENSLIQILYVDGSGE